MSGQTQTDIDTPRHTGVAVDVMDPIIVLHRLPRAQPALLIHTTEGQFSIRSPRPSYRWTRLSILLGD